MQGNDKLPHNRGSINQDNKYSGDQSTVDEGDEDDINNNRRILKY